MTKIRKTSAAGFTARAFIICGLILGLLMIPAAPALAAPDSAVSGNAIEVVGSGSVKVKPDIAVLNIGVLTNGKTTDVQAENTKTMNAVIASIKALGIAEKDIKTVNYYMNPEYDYSNTKTDAKIIGYSVYNVIEVKVRDITKAGSVLSAASEAGANINNGISFGLSSVEEYYNQALALAMANAKSKAGALATAIGVKIGLPTKVTENSSYYSPAPYANYDLRATGGLMEGSAAISQGETEVSASVTVVYGFAG